MRIGAWLVLGVLTPAAAWAQPGAFAVSERPAAGLVLGPSANGDHNSGEWGGDIGFVFDTPVVFGYRVRADVSRVSWRFQDNASHVPPPETVTLKSIRMGILSVHHLGPRTATYAGTGYGVYRFEIAGVPQATRWRNGVHALAGVETLSPDGHLALDWELRVHGIRGPDEAPVISYTLFKLDAALGVKVRF